MIISHKHKFIFIKTEKTAGTSIEIALSRICGPEDIITPLTKVDEDYRNELGFPGKQNYFFPFSTYTKKDMLSSIYRMKRLGFYNHISAKEIKKRIPSNIWEEYFKFCFERNPFDKFVSWYFWLEGDSKYSRMRDFIKSGLASKIRGFELYTIDSIPVVDKIYKYEEISQAIHDINKMLHLNDEIELPNKKLKGNIRKNKKHYREILTDYEIEWLSKIFARELSYFQYKY